MRTENPTKCGCYTLALASPDNRRGMVVPARCGCWDCLVMCGEELRKKWLAKATKAFARIGIWEYTVCTPKQYEALTNRLRRHNRRQFYRIRLNNDISHVFHQPLLQTRQNVPDASKWINGRTALKLFAEVLAQSNVKRVSCSMALAEPESPKKPSEWIREAVVRQSVRSMNCFLRSVGIERTIVAASSFPREILDSILLRGLPSSARVNELPPWANPASSPSVPMESGAEVAHSRKTPSSDHSDVEFVDEPYTNSEDCADPDFALLR